MAITNREDAIKNLTDEITNDTDGFLKPTSNLPIKASNLQKYFTNLLSWIFPKATIAPFEDLSGKVLTVQYNEDSSANTDYDNLAFTTMMPLGGITMFALNGKNVDIGNGVYVPKYGTTYDKILDGFLFCDGSAIDLTQAGNFKYKPLKNLLIGYYENFNDNWLRLPNMKGRVPLGFDYNTSATPTELPIDTIPATNIPKPNVGVKNYGKTGNSGGEDSIKLSLNEMPKHSHVSRGASIYMTSQDNFQISSFDYDSRDITYANNQSTDNTNRTTENNSSNEYEHENRMEYMVLNYIIKY